MLSPSAILDFPTVVKEEDSKSEKGSESTKLAFEGKSSKDDLTVLDPDEGKKTLEEMRKRTYKLNRHFQDNWAHKLSWAEIVIRADGTISQVK